MLGLHVFFSLLQLISSINQYWGKSSLVLAITPICQNNSPKSSRDQCTKTSPYCTAWQYKRSRGRGATCSEVMMCKMKQHEIVGTTSNISARNCLNLGHDTMSENSTLHFTKYLKILYCSMVWCTSDGKTWGEKWKWYIQCCMCVCVCVCLRTCKHHWGEWDHGGQTSLS